MTRLSAISGDQITNIVGTGSQPDSFKFVIKHDKLDKAPLLGDLLIVEDQIYKWVARVEKRKHVCFGDVELQLQELIIDEEISDEEKSIYFGEEFTINLIGKLIPSEAVSPIIRIVNPKN